MPDLSGLPPSLQQLPPGARPAARRFRPVEAEVPEGQVACTGCAGWRCRPRSRRRCGSTQSGLLTDEPVAGAETLVDGGWILPGLVDAHCHVGLGPEGAVDARGGRRAGAHRPRCGRPAPPRLRLAARHHAAAGPRRPPGDHPRGPAPGPAQALHPGARRRPGRPGAAARARSPSRPRRATAGSSSSATGSTGASATWPRCGPTTCWWPPSTPRTRPARGSPRTCSAPTRCRA